LDIILKIIKTGMKLEILRRTDKKKYNEEINRGIGCMSLIALISVTIVLYFIANSTYYFISTTMDDIENKKNVLNISKSISNFTVEQGTYKFTLSPDPSVTNVFTEDNGLVQPFRDYLEIKKQYDVYIPIGENVKIVAEDKAGDLLQSVRITQKDDKLLSSSSHGFHILKEVFFYLFWGVVILLYIGLFKKIISI
jgi:hypothetical protein